MHISVIIPSYNCAGFIDETLQSVVSQLPADCEVVVVDDGSTDATRERLEKWEKSTGVRALLREHRGPSGARNAGLEAARGEFVTFLDCDDKYREGFFAAALPLRRRRTS